MSTSSSSPSGEVAAKATPFRVLLDPFAQARPFEQQRLVRDLDAAFGHGDEAGDPSCDLHLHVEEAVPALEAAAAPT